MMTEEFNESMINDIKEGDKITGEVQQIEDKHVVVHVNGGKYNGIIPISQLSTYHVENANEVVKVGDEIGAYVTKIEVDEENETGSYILSKRKLEEEQSYAYLQEKLENNETIEAKVTEVVKGGLVVDVGQRGFIPASLISTDYIEDFSDYEGRVLELKVEELEPEKNRVILSRKAVEAEENEKKKAELLQSIKAGDVIEGKVMRLASFGAFVEIGSGLQGLVHISEISHKHIGTPGEVLEPGQTVQVKILGINPEEERISLSIKAANPDEETEEASEETTQHYTQPADENENNPTLGDVFGDKLKDLNL
ncbi:TPA: S1 RNA-binding domain-containing protein [Staphylococcus pseudintermedius]|nr:S1 RNA-binding domain-containing protein [Staphylococcus pseudintermedius]HDV6120441.1 S1 RNA-binding domain-containing protein [Staphylococcus pseudintermedius]